MSQPKKRNIKKYNPDVDIVPLHPTGFGIASDKEGGVFVLDFISENLRNSSNDMEIVLGSYSITRKMAEKLVSNLSNTLDRTNKTEEVKDDSKS